MDRQFKKEVQDACKFLRETGKRCVDERMAAIMRGEDVPDDILTYVVKTKSKQSGQVCSASASCANFDFVNFLVATKIVNGI